MFIVLNPWPPSIGKFFAPRFSLLRDSTKSGPNTACFFSASGPESRFLPSFSDLSSISVKRQSCVPICRIIKAPTTPESLCPGLKNEVQNLGSRCAKQVNRNRESARFRPGPNFADGLFQYFFVELDVFSGTEKNGLFPLLFIPCIIAGSSCLCLCEFPIQAV